MRKERPGTGPVLAGAGSTVDARSTEGRAGFWTRAALDGVVQALLMLGRVVACVIIIACRWLDL